MNKDETGMDDDLQSEYDLRSLRVRKVGSGRKSFGGVNIRLKPDVAEMFPDSEAVNIDFVGWVKALRNPTLLK